VIRNHSAIELVDTDDEDDDEDDEPPRLSPRRPLSRGNDRNNRSSRSRTRGGPLRSPVKPSRGSAPTRGGYMYSPAPGTVGTPSRRLAVEMEGFQFTPSAPRQQALYTPTARQPATPSYTAPNEFFRSPGGTPSVRESSASGRRDQALRQPNFVTPTRQPSRPSGSVFGGSSGGRSGGSGRFEQQGSSAHRGPDLSLLHPDPTIAEALRIRALDNRLRKGQITQEEYDELL
jgi:hypothetical protein